MRSTNVQPAWHGTEVRSQVCDGLTITTGKPSSIGTYQSIFASDLVPGVLPVRVAQRRRFGHRLAGRRCLVGRSGTDEDVLVDPVAEQLKISLNVIRGERDPIHDDVEFMIT